MFSKNRTVSKDLSKGLLDYLLNVEITRQPFLNCVGFQRITVITTVGKLIVNSVGGRF